MSLPRIGVDIMPLTEKAYILGYKAFFDNIPCKPDKDENLMELLTNNTDTKALKISWLKGWTDANMELFKIQFGGFINEK